MPLPPENHKARIPRFRTRYEPTHGTALAKLLNIGWNSEDVDKYLGEPDCIGINGGLRYGSERTYLGGIGIEHIRNVNPGSRLVYERVVCELIGQYVKFEGFPWFVLTRSDIAEPNLVVQVRRQDEVRFAKVTSVFAKWAELALIKARILDDGPAVLEAWGPQD